MQRYAHLTPPVSTFDLCELVCRHFCSKGCPWSDGAMEIPVVDFSKCALGSLDVSDGDVESLGEAIYDAFSTVGFVYLKNTGITRDQVHRIFSTANKFFELDYNVKSEFAKSKEGDVFGYVGVDTESTNPERPGDLKEAFNITARALVKPSARWPDKYVSEFSNEMREFYEVCRQLSMRLLEALSSGMKLKDKEYFAKSHSRMNGEGNYTTLRCLCYPPIPDGADIKPGQIRLGEHSDFGSLTLLFQDDVGGLQVEGYDGKFVEAVPISDTILVNIGDILQHWTNGRLKSTRHRVLIPEDTVKKGRIRRSIAFFVHPDDEVVLSEIEYGASAKAHRKSRQMEYEAPVNAYDFVVRRLEKIYK